MSGPSGGTPAVAATGNVSFTGSNNPSDAETVTIYDTVPWLNLENDANGAAGNVAVTVPVGGRRRRQPRSRYRQAHRFGHATGR